MGRVCLVQLASDNLVSFTLETDGAPLDMTSVTRVVVEVDDGAGTELDSDVITMDWLTLVDGAYPVTFLSSATGLSPGVYRDCKVRIFDGNSVDGLVWPDPLTLVVTE